MKKQTIYEKDMGTITTNDGYVISVFCCDPYQTTKEINRLLAMGGQ